MHRNADGPRIVAVDRALSLLIALGEQEHLSVTDAARTLDVAASTAHRILTTLVGRGFAVQDTRRRYRAGPALLAPGRMRGTSSLVDRVRPFLEQLFEATQDTCHLVVREGTQVRFLDGVEGTRSLRVGLRTGARMPAAHTSGGKAMLSELSGAERGALNLPPAAGELGAEPAASPGQLLGVNRDETEPGVTALGASLGHIDGHHAALTVAAPTALLTAQRTRELSRVLLEVSGAARGAL